MPTLISFAPAQKARTLKLGAAAASVLTRHCLASSDLAARYADNPEAFVIRLGDLTPEGLEFAKTGFQRWLSNTDRWKLDPPVEQFAQALERQLAKFAPKAL